MKSEEGSTVCDDSMMKYNEVNYEKFEDAFYSRLITLLSSLS